MEDPQPATKKYSFDAKGRAAEILYLIDEKSSLKVGRFINLCIELAAHQALDILMGEIGNVRDTSPKGLSAAEQQLMTDVTAAGDRYVEEHQRREAEPKSKPKGTSQNNRGK